MTSHGCFVAQLPFFPARRFQPDPPNLHTQRSFRVVEGPVMEFLRLAVTASSK